MELESAIPPHLVQERTQPLSMPANYQPPFPAYSARFPTSIKDIVMAIIGAQHLTKPASESEALAKLQSFVSKGSEASQPKYWTLASCTDTSGAFNEVLIAYWISKADYLNWTQSSGFTEWWDSLNPEQESHGWFKEVLFPPVERFETVFSDNIVPEGAANMREEMSGQIQEHVYWGSMRDRMAASQTDKLEGSKMPSQPAESNSQNINTQSSRIKVPGRKNLAVIRSGQDWSNTNPHERKLYLETMHPVLIKGMTFLRDQGAQVGCFSNRFMEVLPNHSSSSSSSSSSSPPSPLTTTMKTFGLAYFNDLRSLEGWSKQHKTHLDIFGRFLQYAKELQNQVSLRLFHEVLVLEPHQQDFEYLACHPRTGMLASL